MRVVKLGGSLMASGRLLPCLHQISLSSGEKTTIVVPGGGGFADQVRNAQRQWRFDDGTAHSMALLAMKQTALLIKALKPEFALFDSVSGFLCSAAQQKVAIWSPDLAELDRAGIPATWNITSDSLSAWLARTLSADELILVKSVKIAADSDISKLVEHQVVDASFSDYTHRAAFKVTILHAENFLATFR